MNSIPEITMPVFNRKSFYQCFRAISKICLNIRSLPKAPGPEIYIPTLLCRVYHILKANVFTIKSGSQSIYIVESLYLQRNSYRAITSSSATLEFSWANEWRHAPRVKPATSRAVTESPSSPLQLHTIPTESSAAECGTPSSLV